MDSVTRAQSEIELVQKRSQELHALRQTLSAELEQAHHAVEAARVAFASESQTLSEREASLKAERESLEAKRRESTKLSQEIASLRLQSESLKTRIENFNAQITQRRAKAMLARQIEERKQSIERGTAQLAELQHALETLRAELADAQAKRAALLESIGKAKESLLNLRAEERAKQSRASFLNALLESYEGLPEGVKFLDAEKNKAFGLGALLGFNRD